MINYALSFWNLRRQIAHIIVDLSSKKDTKSFVYTNTN